MLVLTRWIDEEIVINGNIVVKVLEVRDSGGALIGGKVRLGITAPENIPVHRREVQNEIDQERVEPECAT